MSMQQIMLGLVGTSSTQVTYQGESFDTSSLTTYTFTSEPIGDASADRVVVIGTMFQSNGSGATVSTVTVGGTGLTLIKDSGLTDAINSRTFTMWGGVVASGSTASIVVTGSAGAVGCGILVASVHNSSGTPTTSYADFGNAPDDAGSVSINAPENGGSVGMFHAGNISASDTITWVGLTEDVDVGQDGVFRMGVASEDFSSAQTGLTVSATISAATNNGIGLCVASYGP